MYTYNHEPSLKVIMAGVYLHLDCVCVDCGDTCRVVGCMACVDCGDTCRVVGCMAATSSGDTCRGMVNLAHFFFSKEIKLNGKIIQT